MPARCFVLLSALLLFPATLFGQARIPDKPAGAPSEIYRSVVRIEAAVQVPDYSAPWNSGRFGGGIGTGFIIGKNQILTNAHVVSNARRLLVTVHGSPEKYPAKVDFIAHDCDLALLSVEDFSDFDDFPVFKIGGVPELESQVRVIGYPIGGDRLSVTRGVVSRIDYSSYSHSRADQHLVIQIDAAINPGNSGGPVLQDGRVIGVAFQGRRDADNTGYIIPTPVINRFLTDIKDGSYDHYVDLAISTFPLFNPAMRKALQLPADGQGVLISNVISHGTCDGFLKAGDLLVSIDGHPIDSAGQILIDGAKVEFSEIVERKFAGDTVQLRYRSDGVWHDQDIPLKNLPQNQMYAIQYEKQPRYIVFGGLVFQPLDTNLFASESFNDLHVRALYQDYLSKGIFLERPDIVIMTRLLADPINSRLDEFQGMAVDKINGTTVTTLDQAQELLSQTPEKGFHVIEFLGGKRPLVLPADQVADANDRVQRTYEIDQLVNLKE
ncbi:S1-C subfamily serine protease [Haloferula luteola]|uniref:S1-C subfamily serine protease n=1 Tax=Haloferula luteola TaxID=595692 RepID=A0A840V407_9BACT|nr:trypsin-like peptidase domain-containing protein [Haloferula luteola]MBB5352263.1 S1-C subfamily serine protease [Haloferula luteola]